MRRTFVLSLLLALLGLPFAASAEVVRAFVSTTGTDDPACSRSAPCRTIGAAIAAVVPNGEIVVLDSGGYGRVWINKPVTIVAPAGVYAAIAPTEWEAIDVHVGAAESVRLINLNLVSRGGTYGVRYETGGELVVENGSIVDFNYGIYMAAGSATISGSVIRGGANAVSVPTTATARNVVVAGSRLEGNSSTGVLVGGNARAVVTGSILASNGFGVYVTGEIGTPAGLTLNDSVVAFNGTGVRVLSSSTTTNAALARLTRSSIVDNMYEGVFMTGAVAVYTSGDNAIHGNSTNVAGGSLTALPAQ